jgi:hypothetical protein
LGEIFITAPKRKSYTQKQRLAAAEKWVPTYVGENLVKGYSNWFGADKICAIKELELLDHDSHRRFFLVLLFDYWCFPVINY